MARALQRKKRKLAHDFPLAVLYSLPFWGATSFIPLFRLVKTSSTVETRREPEEMTGLCSIYMISIFECAFAGLTDDVSFQFSSYGSRCLHRIFFFKIPLGVVFILFALARQKNSPLSGLICILECCEILDYYLGPGDSGR